MEQKDICRNSNRYRQNVNDNIELLYKAKTIVLHLMNMVRHITDKYYIGGSVAAEILGCHLNRRLHDIDVIIPKGCFYTVYQYFHKCPLFETTIVSDYGLDNIKNIMIIVNDIRIDIIESDYEKDDVRFRYPFADIKTLIDAKKHYNRAKDEEDMPELLRVYKNIVGEDYPIDNNDVVL